MQLIPGSLVAVANGLVQPASFQRQSRKPPHFIFEDGLLAGIWFDEAERYLLYALPTTRIRRRR
ncbi:hypothetical protein XH86_20970 [Bradyrhizobium guangdongense]|uniref:Uncharacterized protein n=1 Tax=Bradyrhizobium guangdongense TaxID=1325090 RepID=A0ABX6UI82_9BRAD|nr:hypothetical protein X265_20945 [Bradyrhizobium guangdongense]QOZ60922.1 hypothetical protein XH86_20970 [Bradyrhizobium guangdongense]